MTAPAQDLTFHEFPLASRRDALLLAAQTWPDSEREAQLAAIDEMVTGGRQQELLLVAARRGGTLVGAGLAQLLAGRTAVVWPPQMSGTETASTAAQLLEVLVRRLTTADVVLAQALVENPRNRPAEILVASGFEHAGDLVYMCAVTTSFPSKAPVLPLGLESWSHANMERMLRIVEATYQGSLDCPRIDGLRDTRDVLDGYCAVGKSGRQHWLIATSAGNDAGCLLVADHPDQQQMEIVYLGIVPDFRGRGWGLALTRQAQWTARSAGRERVVLAVDAANQPAIAAYTTAGFVAWDRRSVLVRPLAAAVKHATATG